MRSIRRNLTTAMLAAIVLAVALTAGFVYRDIRSRTDDLLDAQLRQLVLTVPAPRSPMLYDSPFDRNGQEDIVIQMWDERGVRLYHSTRRWRMPRLAQLGFATVETPDGPLRVYSALRDGVVVQAAQPIAVRREVAAGMAARQVLPLALLGVALAILAGVIVSRGLAPLGAVRRALAHRTPGSLQPLDAHDLPDELQPVVGEMNALLQRLDRAIGEQRSFVADAAHELRTPLTALQLQIGALSAARDERERTRASPHFARGSPE
ncbi:MAG: histidine kinase dimerization/phospho-acceptor domain-containing protein [Burkholderiaceae bacterium]